VWGQEDIVLAAVPAICFSPEIVQITSEMSPQSLLHVIHEQLFKRRKTRARVRMASRTQETGK
jgi:hypothetical protein